MLYLDENPFGLVVLESEKSAEQTFDACNNEDACGIHTDDEGEEEGTGN